MSRTVAIEYRERHFWAFDAALAVWLIEIVNAATSDRLDEDPWWAGHLRQWRVATVLGANVGHQLPHDWDEQRFAQFLDISRRTIESLRVRRSERGATLAALRGVDGETTCADRYAAQDQVDLEPIAVLGQAILDLVLGQLPQPPAGSWWYFGEGSQPATITMRDGAGSG